MVITEAGGFTPDEVLRLSGGDLECSDVAAQPAGAMPHAQPLYRLGQCLPPVNAPDCKVLSKLTFGGSAATRPARSENR